MAACITPVVVPYAGNIPGGVRQGVEIEIQGTLPHHSGAGFSVNISQGPNIEPNTLLHFNVRPNQNCVVLNHLHNNGWGGEDRKPQHFHKGEQFDLRIKVKPDVFQIKVNGSHFADFPHRIPKDMGQFLLIKGEVSVNFIRYHSEDGHHDPPPQYHHDNPAGFAVNPSFPAPGASSFPAPGASSFPAPGASSYPAPAGGFASPPYGGGFVSPSPGGAPMAGVYPSAAPSGGPMYNPPVPLKTTIPGGLVAGRMIAISGIPHDNPSRFVINLQNGQGDGNILMHMDVRFRCPDGSVNTVVRNNCHGGGWGQEERQLSYFPFTPNANFDIIILTEQHAFKVAVNNQHLLEFRHRQPFQQADTLSISGDVRLTQIRFQ